MKLVDDVGFDGAFSFALQPAPGHAGGRARRPGAARRRSRRGSRALQARLDAQYRALQRGDGRHAAARAGHRPRRRDARELAARTENNRVVNFAGDADARSARYVDVDDHRGAARIRCAASSPPPNGALARRARSGRHAFESERLPSLMTARFSPLLDTRRSRSPPLAAVRRLRHASPPTIRPRRPKPRRSPPPPRSAATEDTRRRRRRRAARRRARAARKPGAPRPPPRRGCSRRGGRRGAVSRSRSPT